MSYLTYALLTEDVDFGRRARACINQQANANTDQSGSPIDLLSVDLLKGEPQQTVLMLNAICAGPNFAEIVDNGDGTIDSSKITDEQILAHTQNMLNEVAKIFYPIGAASPPSGPSATSVSPTSGTNGTTIVITGTGLTGTTAVSLAGVACTGLTVLSSTQVRAVTPVGPSKGSKPLNVTVGSAVLQGLTFQVT